MKDKRNILISGSSRGIGREISQLLDSSDFNIITMGNATKNTADFYADLSDPLETQKVVKKIHSIHGQISVLICNAGGGKKPEKLNDLASLKEYFIKLNFETAKNLIEASIPYLQPTDSSIVGISSIVALKEIEGAPPGYSESKVALNQYFRSNARSLASLGIRLNIISLGNVNFNGSRWEEIGQNSPDFVQELLNKRVPLRMFITPQEVVDAILYLTSDSARNITGENIVIDGGQSL